MVDTKDLWSWTPSCNCGFCQHLLRMDGGEGDKKWRGDIIPGEKENLAATPSPMGFLIRSCPGQPSPRSVLENSLPQCNVSRWNCSCQVWWNSRDSFWPLIVFCLGCTKWCTSLLAFITTQWVLFSDWPVTTTLIPYWITHEKHDPNNLS